MERQPRRRRRPAFSCLECRRRKIKCDRNEPCAHCVSAKTGCAYRFYSDEPAKRPQSQHGSSRPSTLSPSAYAPSPLTQTQPINTLRSTTESENHYSGVHHTTAAEQNGPPNIATPNDSRPDDAHDARPDLQDLLQRVQKLEGSSTSNLVQGLSESNRDILARQSGLQDSQIILNKTRILRWSHWLGTAQEFESIVNCYMTACKNDTEASFQEPATGPLIVQMGELLQECKSTARSIKVVRPTRHLFRPESGLSQPSRELADTMVTLYFRSFESTHRILHEPTFLAEYQTYWEHPESITTDLRLKVLLVVGMGSSLHAHGDADATFRNMVHQWIYAAQTWLSGPLEKDRLDITGLQVYCLTILARQIFSIGGDLVWMSMGSLIHRAMQVGLHRDPRHLSGVSVLQAELRRRLWTTILELIVQSALDSAMPPRISPDEFDTEVPSNINDHEMDESTESLQPHPKGTYTATSIQLTLFESLPTRLRILQLLNGLHSQLSYLDVLSLSSDITDACRKCGRFTKEHKRFVTPFHRNLLNYLVRRFMIPLHCPFASQARTNPLFHYSLKASLDAAMTIIFPEPDEGFSRLMAIGGGLFREGIRYSVTIISFELIAQTEADRLEGTLHHDTSYREFLKQAVRDMISLSTERIRQGETNIKAHMFLNMVMAQAAAIEADMPCEFVIARSARDSLEFCLDLLRTRAATVPLPSPSTTSLTPTGFNYGQEGYGLDLDWELFLPREGFI